MLPLLLLSLFFSLLSCHCQIAAMFYIHSQKLFSACTTHDCCLMYFRVLSLISLVLRYCLAISQRLGTAPLTSPGWCKWCGVGLVTEEFILLATIFTTQLSHLGVHSDLSPAGKAWRWQRSRFSTCWNSWILYQELPWMLHYNQISASHWNSGYLFRHLYMI